MAGWRFSDIPAVEHGPDVCTSNMPVEHHHHEPMNGVDIINLHGNECGEECLLTLQEKIDQKWRPL